jgi:hypothetical protein
MRPAFAGVENLSSSCRYRMGDVCFLHFFGSAAMSNQSPERAPKRTPAGSINLNPSPGFSLTLETTLSRKGRRVRKSI